jgi:hypothetical protein
VKVSSKYSFDDLTLHTIKCVPLSVIYSEGIITFSSASKTPRLTIRPFSEYRWYSTYLISRAAIYSGTKYTKTSVEPGVGLGYTSAFGSQYRLPKNL